MDEMGTDSSQKEVPYPRTRALLESMGIDTKNVLERGFSDEGYTAVFDGEMSPPTPRESVIREIILPRSSRRGFQVQQVISWPAEDSWEKVKAALHDDLVERFSTH